jgi:lipid II:glycine glycyltransferase (peptidoglycan interpeptide bridge formation enzyme)
MKLKFRYSDDIPAILLPQVKRILEPLSCYLPDWCHHVYVHADHVNTDDDDANAKIRTFYDYRWASMWIQPSWFGNKDDRELTEDLLHELIHIIRSPVDDWIREIIKTLVPESDASKFHKTLMEELRARAEMVTQDITYMLMRNAQG